MSKFIDKLTPVEIIDISDVKYLGTKVKAKPRAYIAECYENDNIDFTNLTISETKRKNLGSGCENTLMFQFEGQADPNHWYPAKHFLKLR